MKKISIILSLLLLSIGHCYAQEDQGCDTLGLLNGVMKRLEEKSRYIPTINGSIQGGYIGQYTPTTKDHHYNNSFTLNQARLNIKGRPADWFDYNMQLNFVGKPQILDINLNVHPLAKTKAKSQYINFWAGQSKTPLSLESAYGPTNFEAVSYSKVVSELCGYNHTLTSAGENDYLPNMGGGRDIGVAIYGYALRVNWGGEAHDFFSYKVGVYNGSGMNSKDQDNMKDVSGFFYMHPIKPITIGGSFYIGAYKMLVATKSGTEQRQTRRDRWAASFRYDDGQHWMARAEYIGGKTHGQYSDGWYGSLQYTINPNPKKINQWAVLTRYDGYRSHSKTYSGYISHQVMVGCNYRPVSWLYLQANYCLGMDQTPKTTKMVLHQGQVTACLIY